MLNYKINIPKGKLAQRQSDDAAAERRRREIREKLLKGQAVHVTQDDGVITDDQEEKKKDSIVVPPGKLAQSQDDVVAAKRRREIREKLLKGQAVHVTQDDGVITDDQEEKKKDSIVVPPGKLAAGFYWYERDPELLAAEKVAMKKYFPAFKLEKLDDGRLCWIGSVSASNVRANAIWYLEVVYDHNHPHNTSWGGSIKVYSIEPDLEKLSKDLGSIPHTLRDSAGHLYICTADPSDVKVGKINTSAASAISWGVKWIHAFELWLSGDMPTEEFSRHRNI